MRKRIISLLLSAVILFTLCPNAFAAKTEKAQLIKTAPELYNFTYKASLGTVGIAKAKLYRSIIPETVYIISLRATGNLFNRLNNPFSSFICGLSLETEYLRTVKSFARELIPYGAKVMLIGHSLGGMIAQQFMADTEMKLRYNILNSLALGAPCVLTGPKEGSLHRLVDTADIIPYTTPLPIHNFTCCISREDGGMIPILDDAHHCYGDVDEWGAYDCFGIKGGHYSVSVRASDFVCRS